MALNNTVTSTATTTSSTTNGDDKARGYVLIGIGILLIGGPIVSLAGWLLSSSSNIAAAAACDGDGGTTFYRYWIEHEHRPHAYYWRVLTFLPAVLVVAMCHWVSLRIYLRR